MTLCLFQHYFDIQMHVVEEDQINSNRDVPALTFELSFVNVNPFLLPIIVRAIALSNDGILTFFVYIF
jgi:hypothetical protein